MTPRLAHLAKRFTAAESSHEQLLGFWLKVFWLKFWQVKRQVIIEPYGYRLDLAIVSKHIKIAVEVDGRYWHRQGDRPLKDARRDELLERQGWDVIRFTDREVEVAPAACARYAVAFAKKVRKANSK